MVSNVKTKTKMYGNSLLTFQSGSFPNGIKPTLRYLFFQFFMIPGALTALQPIDMESYEMESPELTAQTIINEEFANSEIILGFVISARDPTYVPDLDSWSAVEPMSDGAPDYSSLPGVHEMVEAGEPWQGISAPKGGILNLTVLQEIDAKKQIVYDHVLAPALKPLVNDVIGHQYSGVHDDVGYFPWLHEWNFNLDTAGN